MSSWLRRFQVGLLAVLALVVAADVTQVSAQQGPRQKGRRQPRVVAVHKDVELTVDEAVKIRLKDLPIAFDDKGRPRQYTAEELREKKGPDPRLPGYAGDFSELKPGQLVRVSLGKKTDTPRGKADEATGTTPAGQLTGQLVQVGGSGRGKDGKKEGDGKGKGKKNAGSLTQLVLRVESISLSRGPRYNKPGEKGDNRETLDDDIVVTMVQVLADGQLPSKK